MKNIFKKSLFILMALPLITGCGGSEGQSGGGEGPKVEPSLVIDVDSVKIEKFEYLQLTYTLKNSTETVKWASSNPSVVTISEDGLIYGVGVGDAYINATAGDLVSSCTVTVSPSSYAPSLVFDTDEITLEVESSFEQDLYVSFKGLFEEAEIDLSIKNGESTSLIDYSYDAKEGRMLISSKLTTGETTLVAGIEIYDAILVHEFVVTVVSL